MSVILGTSSGARSAGPNAAIAIGSPAALMADASVGLESHGAAELLLPALEHAAGLLFAVAPPPGAGFRFSLDNSQSHAEWLHRRPCQVAPT